VPVILFSLFGCYRNMSIVVFEEIYRFGQAYGRDRLHTLIFLPLSFKLTLFL